MRFLTVSCLALLAAASACHRGPEWLEIERFEPGVRNDSLPRLALNQPLTVYFTEPVDPLSVSSASFRIADADGRSVDGFLEIGTRSVRFRPRAPVTAALDDGSFRPGARFRLEVAGMPSSLALRSRAGRPLERSIAFPFEIARTPGELHLSSLFLPVGIGDEPFVLELADPAGLRLAADTKRLSFRLNMPPLPSSATPAAVRLWRLVSGAAAPQSVPIERLTVIVPEEGRTGGSSTAVVTLELAAHAALAGGDLCFLQFESGPEGLVDYRGRPLQVPPTPLPVKVDPGDRVRVRDLDLAELEFEPYDDAELGFEIRDGRVVARARVEAGSGSDGVLRPEGGEAVRLDGPGGAEFARIEIGPGEELRLVPDDGPLVLRVTGDVRIRGRLVLVHSGREAPWRAGRSPGVDELARAARVCLIVGGDFIVERGGEVVVEDPGTGSPLTLIVAGTPIIEGRVPPQITLALGANVRVHGVLETPIVLPSEMTPGVPSGARLRAAAATAWIALPTDRGDAIDITLLDVRGTVSALLQVAPPDVVRPDRPRSDAERLVAPMRLPLREPLVVPRGAYFRILLEAEVDDGVLPSLAGFVVHAR